MPTFRVLSSNLEPDENGSTKDVRLIDADDRRDAQQKVSEILGTRAAQAFMTAVMVY